MMRPPPRSTLFPYTPLFRSARPPPGRRSRRRARDRPAGRLRTPPAARSEEHNPELPPPAGNFYASLFFFLNDAPPTEIYPLPLHAALPICSPATWPAIATPSARSPCRSPPHPPCS